MCRHLITLILLVSSTATSVNGQALFAERALTQLDRSGFTQLAWGDVDADGDWDLLANSEMGREGILLISDGDDLNKAPVAFPSGLLSWGDMNRDGRLDVLSEQGVWIQREDGSFEEPNSAFKDSSWIRILEWDEQSGDIFVSGHIHNGSTLWHALYQWHPSSGLVLNQEWRGSPRFRFETPWLDIDGDGDADLLRGWDTASRPGFHLTVFALRRDKSAVTDHLVPITIDIPKGERMPNWGPDYLWPSDYDTDGDLDFLMSVRPDNDSRLLLLYTQEETGWQEHLIQAYDDDYFLIAEWHDLAGDGNPDIIAFPLSGSSSNWTGPPSTLYENRGVSIFGPHKGFREVDGESSIPHENIAFVDMDGDGDLDATRMHSSQVTVSDNLLGETGGEVPLPRNLKATVDKNDVTLSWDPALNHTLKPLVGASYNVELTGPNGERLGPSALALEDGTRLLPQLGNNGIKTTRLLQLNIPGTYKWKVQTIDSVFRGSAFVEGAFNFAFASELPAAEAISWTSDDGWSGKLTAIVNPKGTETKVSCQWGLGESYSNETTPLTVPAGAAPVTLQIDITGFAPSKDYLVRVVAENDSGRVISNAIPVVNSFLTPIDLESLMFDASARRPVKAGDLNSDGDLDLLVYGRVYHQNRAGGFQLAHTIAENVSAPSSSTLVDIDLDGRLDIAARGGYHENARQGLTIFLNTDQGFMRQVIATDIDQGGEALWRDMDGDGDIDVIASTTVGNEQRSRLLLWRNDGEGRWTPESLDLPEIPGIVQHLSAEDLDRDGDPDLMLSFYDSVGMQTLIYYQEGEGRLRWYRDPSRAIRDIVSTLVDLDTDGDLDAAGVSALWINEGDESFTRVPFEGTPTQAWADVDHDGDLDALLYQRPQTTVMLQTAPLIFDKLESGLPDLGNTKQALQWADIDGNRILDLITPAGIFRQEQLIAEGPPTSPSALRAEVAGRSVTLNWNPGSDTQTAQPRLTYTVEVANEATGERVLSQPVAGDRLMSSVAGNSGTTTFHKLTSLEIGRYHWHVRTVDETTFVSVATEGPPFEILTSTALPTTHVRSNKQQSQRELEGRIDTNNLETTYYFELGETETYGNRSETRLVTGATEALSVTESLPDLINGNSYHYRLVAENALGKFESADGVVDLLSFEPTSFDVTGVSRAPVLVGDLNHDGYPDYRLRGSSSWRQCQTTDSGHDVTGCIGRSLRLPSDFNPIFEALGDLNQTGLWSFVRSGFANGMGLRVQVIPLPFDIESVREPFKVLHTLPTFGEELRLSDFDRDGDLDILTSQPSLWRNTGTGFVETPLPGAFQSGISCVWGDYDQDGDDDILLAARLSSEAPHRAYLLKQDTHGFVLQALPIPEFDMRQLTWQDDDLDGDLDILASGTLDGRSYVTLWRQTSIGVFEDASEALPPLIQAAALPVWGDMDGDGDSDMVIGSYSEALLYRQDDGNYHTVLDRFPNASQPSLGKGTFIDLDADGDRDLILSGHIYRNTRRSVMQNGTSLEPQAPHGLQLEVEPQGMRFSWEHPNIHEGFSYNLRVGLTPEGSELLSAMALESGKRLLPKLGNAGFLTERFLRRQLPPGTTVYWAVQSIDPALNASSFSEELKSQVPARWEIQAIRMDNGMISLTFPSERLTLYTIQHSSTMDFESWIDLKDVQSSSLQTTVELEMPGISPTGFLRIQRR